MQVFLTGATGFTGQALVRAINRRGWKLTVLVRQRESPAARWVASKGALVLEGDITERRGLAELLHGHDLLIHNAGLQLHGSDAASAARMQRVNVQGTDHVLEAAQAARLRRTVCVSSAWGLGPSGLLPAASTPRDESRQHDGRYRSLIERSKAEAHQLALDWRGRGLPLVLAMPTQVVGANDPSPYGYLLRLSLLGLRPPLAFGGDAVLGFVGVDALAEGLCLAGEQAEMGTDFIFSGPRTSVRELFAIWHRTAGLRPPRLHLPRWAVRPTLPVLEPLQRLLGLPPFLSRATLDASRCHLDYSAARAQRLLGWKHPTAEALWQAIIVREQALVDRRRGLLGKLRHQATAEA